MSVNGSHRLWRVVGVLANVHVVSLLASSCHSRHRARHALKLISENAGTRLQRMWGSSAASEINRPGHPVREAALAHLRAREELVRQFLTAAGVEDADLATQVTLLVDGAYAVGGSRRDPTAARRAKAAAAAFRTLRFRVELVLAV